MSSGSVSADDQSPPGDLSSGYEYTIAISNYNMGDTIGDSLQTILDQVDDRYEVLVVDDGSTDNSVEVLRRLEASDERVRVLELPRTSGRKLGVTRNISVHAADGKYVLLHLDADDAFEEVITDVVEVYRQVDDHIDRDFYFMCCGFGIGRRDFLLEHGPYRNLPVGGEDQDMWRRLFAEDALIWVDSESLAAEISDGKDRLALMRRWLKVAVSNFQTGISYASYLRWSYRNRTLLGFCYDFLLCAPLAYLIAVTRPSYDLPSEFKTKGAVDQRIESDKLTTEELEERHGFRIDRERLSPTTKRLLYLD